MNHNSNQPLSHQLKSLINQVKSDFGLTNKFVSRLEQGKLSRSENPHSHFCVFFAGFDSRVKKVFIGHHIKGDSWMFNGGHIDQGELPLDSVQREMKEEWGEQIGRFQIYGPDIITTCDINNKQVTCRKHYDLWYFVELDQRQFQPQVSLLNREFYDFGWKDVDEAKRLITKAEIHKGLDWIIGHYF